MHGNISPVTSIRINYMTQIDSITLIKGIANDLKIAIDDLTVVIVTLNSDVETLKLKASKPDKLAASLLLDYLSWEEGQSKQNLEKLCGEEIKEYMSWLNYHCKKEGITKEQALKEIIDS
jgi:hypothetical protein